MSYCKECGARVQDQDRFCPNCGNPVNERPEIPEDEGADFISRMKRLYHNIMDTDDHTGEFSSDDAEENGGFALLSYLAVFILVPVFAAKGSRFAKFHVGQGLNLLISFLVYSIAVSLMFAALSWIPGFGNFFRALFYILETFGIVITVLLIVRGIRDAAAGRARELPLFGHFNIIHY